MIYLDNAATSFPKPRRVIEEVENCLEKYGGNPGRGSHKLSLAAAEKIYECREEISSFFGIDDPLKVVFTQNATMALNTVIKGVVQPGDHVLISDLEHNAVLRPIAHLAREGVVSYDVFPSLAKEKNRTPQAICKEIEARIRKNTKLLICTQASNICSACLPIPEIAELCKRHRILFAVDAAQSAGHFQIDLSKMKVDFLCAPGHKGLLGLQGSGFLILGKEINRLNTFIEGGSGSDSLSPFMPEEFPERMEAGTLATPCIAGLCEGIKEVKRIGVNQIFAWEREWNELLKERLSTLSDIQILAKDFQGSILSFSCNQLSSEAIAAELDRRGICVRAGYHCAGLAHKTLESLKGGSVRVSPGMETKKSDADAFLRAMKEILK